MGTGIATIDITPPVGVRLWGYEPRESTFVEHPLRAEALAVSDGDSGWILLTIDVGAVNPHVTKRVRAAVAEATGLPPQAILLAATHTHSGPHVTDAFWAEHNELEGRYFRDLCEKLAKVAIAAWNDRQPGELVVGHTAAPELASNRRIQREDGSWTNRFRDPEGSNPGYFDASVDLLGVRRPDGKLAALLVNYGCHPVAYNSVNLGISGDYVSYLKDALEASGKVETAMFTVSGHANIDPRDGCQPHAHVVKGIGEALAEIVLAALPDLKPVADGPLTVAESAWSFTSTWQLEGRMAIYFPYAERGSPVETTASGLRCGEIAFIGAPGEVVSEYRAMLRERSPFPHTFLLSVVNDFIGYIPTDEIQEQGAYEANISPLRPMQAAFLDRCQAVINQLKESTHHV